MLRKHIRDVESSDEVGSEITYHLLESDVQHFEAIFRDLEKNSERLGITGYGVEPSSMEDVFLRIGAANEVVHKESSVSFSDAISSTRKSKAKISKYNNSNTTLTESY